MRTGVSGKVKPGSYFPLDPGKSLKEKIFTTSQIEQVSINQKWLKVLEVLRGNF